MSGTLAQMVATALIAGLESKPRTLRELAHRSSGGIDVSLYWCADNNRTTIEIWHVATEELFTFPVAPERALDAYYHPFAHLPTTRGALVTAPQA
jgi:hypothetical protein